MTLKYQEIQGDLFSCPSTTSFAHCVSTDMNMSKGIATQFRDHFGRINELKKQSMCLFKMINNYYEQFRYLHRYSSWWLCLSIC